MKMIKNLLWMVVALTAISTGCKKEKKEILATVTTTTATGITGSGAVTGGNITNTGNSAISQSGVVFATHTTPILTDSLRANTSGGNTFTINLTGLNANTVYYVRAFAINATGTTYGNQVTFTTAAGLATVTTTPIGAISTSAATGSSGGTIVNTGGAAITASGVCWSTKLHPTIADHSTNDQVTNNAFTSTLSLLAANTVYYYRAYATNSFGTAYGNELSFNAGSTATVTDVDGNVYNTITIGTQTWMLENLRVTHYQNGDPIPNGATGYNWVTTFTPAYTPTNGDPANNTTYGLFYSGGAVNDARNIAPSGWHVPTDADWYTLEYYEGMTATDVASNPGDNGLRGNFGGKLLAGGSSGLNLQLGGYIVGDTPAPDYQGFGQFGAYWTSTPGTNSAAESNWARAFNIAGTGPVYRTYLSGAMSVRCVKN